MIEFVYQLLETMGFIALLILLYFPVLAIHEYGHYLAFRFFGYKPKFPKINIFGDVEIGRETHKELTLKHCLPISIAGILTGFIPLWVMKMFLPSNIMIIFAICYGLGISGDLNTIYMILSRKNWDMTMYQMNKDVWKGYIKSVSQD